MSNGEDAPRITAGDSGCLVVTGEVTAGSVRALRAEGERLVGSSRSGSQSRGGYSEVCIDLQGVATASSIVLSLLMCWQRFALSQGINIRFTGISDRLHSLASLSGLDRQLSGF